MMDLETFTMTNNLPTLPIKASDLIRAVEHLHRSLSLLRNVRNQISQGILNSLSDVNDLKESWKEVNCCRLYTEDSVAIEEYLQPAMGLINDSKEMIESVVAWKIGLTRHAQVNMMHCLYLAEEAIFTVLESLEGRMSPDSIDCCCPVCKKSYIMSDNFCSRCGLRLA
jgi:hypothetical protein